MKTKLLLFIFFCFLITGFMKAQTIHINTTYDSDTEIFPFDTNDSIYGLSLSGHIELYSDTSLARVILIDTMDNEYMVYEAYPLIVDSWIFDTADVSDETRYMNKTNPYSLKIQLFNAEIRIDSLYVFSTYRENSDSLQELFKSDCETNKVNKMNNNIDKNDMLWYAGKNDISNLSYINKKQMFGNKYNCLARVSGLSIFEGIIYS